MRYSRTSRSETEVRFGRCIAEQSAPQFGQKFIDAVSASPQFVQYDGEASPVEESGRSRLISENRTTTQLILSASGFGRDENRTAHFRA
ncbi:hypothetical protein GCM10025298_29410 [Natronobiforma cellulositropha]